MIAVILALLPVLFSRWADFSTYQRLLCAGGGGFVACTVVFCDWPKLSTVFIIEDRQIKSRRWGKVLCEVRCTGIKNQLFRKDIHKQFIEGERAEWRQFKELLRSLQKK